MKADVAVAAPAAATPVAVPFFRPDLRTEEIAEVVATLESGWLTTGPRVRRFEADFCRAVSAKYAIAVNSCTAALHVAVEAVGLMSGDAVLVPTMTFAATAEIIRYLGGVPVLVDCDPELGHMDLADAARRLDDARHRLGLKVVGMIPVHVGGVMMDMHAVQEFADANGLWVIEDAAHSLPAAWRRDADSPWEPCGGGQSAVTCFSFYANKTVTTGEGGMAVTNDADLAERMRLMSLHGLSHDAWGRYNGTGSWNYDIVAPGFKYNLTDVAAAIGIHQLARAEAMRERREAIAERYRQGLSHLQNLVALPSVPENRISSWHLFPLRLAVERLKVTRDDIIETLKGAGIGTSVHWKPLHLHPYYRGLYRLQPANFPVATNLFRRIVSLPLFPSMTDAEIDHVIDTVEQTLVDGQR